MSPPGRAPDRTSTLVVSLAAILFAASAYNAIRTAYTTKQQAHAQSSSSSSKKDLALTPKLSGQSAVARMTYATRPEDCEAWSAIIDPSSSSHARPKLLAGALFKLIDIAAGVAARRHSGMACVTISVDSVVLLKPIYLGDLIHVSASVNRAWGSSMEVGVRIVKENVEGATEYVSHSYLTFVAIRKDAEAETKKQASSATWPWSLWSKPCADTGSSTNTRPILAPIRPTSRLEARRHFLAGRRRTKRLDDAKKGKTREGVSVQVKERVRQEMETMLKMLEADATPASTTQGQDHENMLRAIELEVIVQAWAQGDEMVKLSNGIVEATMPGDEPIRFEEHEAREKAIQMGISIPGDASFVPLDVARRWANATTVSPPGTPESTVKRLGGQELPKRYASALLPVVQTLTTSMHIVFPQHTNSHGIIFGGNTMSWSEEVAIMACRRLRVARSSPSKGKTGANDEDEDEDNVNVRWKTAAMDGLEFTVQVGVGELMLFSAIVIHTYKHSCEVYVLAQAENRQGHRRFTNDVLFTMAYDVCWPAPVHAADTIAQSSPPSLQSHRVITQIGMPGSSALETFAAASLERRRQRLELRQMLVRVYGS